MPAKRHVWVDSAGGYRYPGLVMAWRRNAAGTWEAQVAVVHTDSVLVEWVAAAEMHPIADDGWDPNAARRP